MKANKLLIGLSLLTLLLLVAACGAAAPQSAAPAQEQAAPAQEEAASGGEMKTETVTIGYTASKTGSQEVSSRNQTRGLELWLEQVNENGITLSDGTVVKFEAKTYDD